MLVIEKKIIPRYANKRFLLKARHPKLHKFFRQRILCGYEQVELLGVCAECKNAIYIYKKNGEEYDDDYETDEDGRYYCDELCKKWYLERL